MPLIARLAMVFAAGAIAGSYLPHLPALLFILPLLLFKRTETTFLLALAVIAIVAASTNAQIQNAECTPVTDRARVHVRGVAMTASSEAQRTIQLKVNHFCKGYVRARLTDDSRDVKIGDNVEIDGTWMQLRVTQANNASTEGMIIATSPIESPYPPDHLLLRVRGRAQQRLQQLFPKGYPLAESLLLAQRENLNPVVKEDFAASGLTHLLAISGSHVAIVGATLVLLSNLFRLSRRLTTLVSIAGSAAYVFFLGAPYAALRALLQMSLLLVSRSLQRPAHPVGLLAAAALFITALDPAAPLDAGFQLSFAGIYGIVMWRRPLIDLLPASLPMPLRDAIATTCAATAITTPIAAFHFGMVSVISLLANLLAAPVMALAVPTTAAALFVSGVSAEAAQFIAGGAELTLLWLASIASKCARVPGGHFFATPAAVGASTLAVLAAFVTFRPARNGSLAGRAALAALAGVLPLVAMPLVERRAALEIHMIDVGQGDAFAIRSPAGRWVLVDAGPKSDRMDAGRRDVVPFLLRHQADQVAAVIVSHPHLDHFGGLASVARVLRVRSVLDPGMAVPGTAYDSMLAATQVRHIPILAARSGVTVHLDAVRLEFLGPDAVPLDASADPNEFSAAFRLRYGGFAALFLGDMPSAAEDRLVEQYGSRLDVDLLKVSHHGSGGSSSPALLLAATPRVALISAGRRNRYGHPHRSALERLEASGARIFRTDRDGTVSVVVDRDGTMNVRTMQ